MHEAGERTAHPPQGGRNCLCETLRSLPADCSSHHRRITSFPSATTSAADVTKHLFSTGGSCAAKDDEAALRASCRSNPLLISLSSYDELTRPASMPRRTHLAPQG